MTVRDASVCFFDSTMTGAPAMRGTAGTLIAVLDDCLVNGFGAVTASSLVVADGIATLTVSAGHGFVNPGGTIADVGIVATVSGVTGALSAINANWRVTVTSATVLTWDCGEIADGTASGTVSIKHASAGWEKAFSGTNLAAYKSGSIEATGCYLRVDDTPAQYPTLIMYESMSEISTGIGPAPLTGSLYMGKSSTANGTSRAWRLYADDKLLYLFVDSDTATWPSAMMFGDIISYRSGDSFCCALIAHSAANTTSYLRDVDGAVTASFVARPFHQQGGAIPASRYSHRRCANVGYGGMGTINYADNKILHWPIEIWENTDYARGLLPGALCPVHNGNITQGFVSVDEAEVVVNQKTYSNSYSIAFHLTKSWR
jgi:hypothetical protein